VTDETPENTDGDRSLARRAGEQFQRMVHHVLHQGIGPVTGSVPFAEDRRERFEDPETAIRRVRNESVLAAGSAGFLTGVGGLVTLPVTLPANLAGSLIINVRMTGAIAHLRGWNLDDPHTEAMAAMIAAGSSAQAALSAFGVRLGTEGAKQAIKAVPMTLIREINKKAGFMLVAKYGTKRSAVTLAKAVPLAGGFVGGGVDAALTAAVGRAAVGAFPR
jgi:hypothetical protein